MGHAVDAIIYPILHGRKIAVDGKTVPGLAARQMYLILNLAVGGSGGGTPPASVRSAEMLVD